MSEIARITVPWDVARTGDNKLRRLHWAQVHNLRSMARERSYLAWKAAGAVQVREKVRVSIIVRRGRGMDVANIIGGLKPLLDGVFVGYERRHTRVNCETRVVKEPGMLPDDSAEWLEIGAVTQESGKQWRGREEVVFVIESLAPAGAGLGVEGT